MEPASSPLDKLPNPLDIHSHMGRLYRELALLRRLLRLIQTANSGQFYQGQRKSRQEVTHAR